jgi:DNA-binding NarL/FixJ family response regulator
MTHLYPMPVPQLNVVFNQFYCALKEKKEDLSSHLIVLLSLLGDKDLNIWIADDDADDRELFAEAMSDIAPNVKVMQYLSDPGTDLPDTIFLDLNMPQKSGLECLEELRGMAKFKNVAIVIYSTSANPTQIDETYKIGANLYIQKPSQFDGIKSLLHKMLSLQPDDYFPQPSRSKFVLNV